MSLNTFQTLSVAVLISTVLFLLIVGLLDPSPAHPKAISSTQASSQRLNTDLHDGHWFVTLGGSRGGVCHHPDCPKCKDRKHE